MGMEPPTPPERLATLEKGLNLTAEQSAAIEPILVDEYEQGKALGGKPGQDRRPEKDMRQKQEDLEWDICMKLSAHLTREQMLGYSKLLREGAKAGEARKQGRPCPSIFL